MVGGHDSTGAVGETGARFRRSGGDRDAFPVVMRGYDRAAVDGALAAERAAQQDLRARLEAAERRVGELTAQTAARVRSQRQRPAADSDGFGMRAEKLLRLAEREADEIRTGASRESVALLERARVEAERHRHASEQEVIQRLHALDEQERRSGAQLAERERVAEQAVAVAREEAERLQVIAAEAASRVRAEAGAEAERIRDGARAEAERMLATARDELDRLHQVHAGVHEQLDRLRRAILDGLETPS